MPALITHDYFAEDVLATHPDACGASQIHRQKPTEVLYAFVQALGVLPAQERAIARAYVNGFLCHYALDSSVHPLVYYLSGAICDAGIEGLDRSGESQVHGAIEAEYDEMMLFTRSGRTIATFAPADHILVASDALLGIIDKLFGYVALTVFGQRLEAGTYAIAVRRYRAVLRLIHSPRGIKRSALDLLERSVRGHSLLAAMSMRPIEAESTWFANPTHDPWENPFTGEASTASFDDLYAHALDLASRAIEAASHTRFSLDDARAITGEVNFRGAPVVATLVVHDS